MAGRRPLSFYGFGAHYSCTASPVASPTGWLRGPRSKGFTQPLKGRSGTAGPHRCQAPRVRVSQNPAQIPPSGNCARAWTLGGVLPCSPFGNWSPPLQQLQPWSGGRRLPWGTGSLASSAGPAEVGGERWSFPSAWRSSCFLLHSH